jgi:hypothetical protein
MKNQKETIRKIVRYLNNPETDGGFWLPNIQRPFVWREDQIERLFDSILREYPISTLLVWKTKAKVRRRKFIDNYWHSLKLTEFYVPDDDKSKLLVLDGQQRLQSLFIGLCGSYEGKELFLDILSGELREPEDVKYVFKFLDAAKAQPPWFKFKDLVFSDRTYDDLADHLVDKFPEAPTRDDQRKIRRHVAQVVKTFQVEETIVYQELDSIDRPELYTEEDVVEVFIRANSGGTRLGKSDLLFSLLISAWDEADDRMEELLYRLNAKGYAFTRDFILKTCLTLLNKGARYEVEKFRDGTTRQEIEDNWERISTAVLDVQDFLFGKTFVRCDKALPSYLVLIPVIHFRYHYADKWRSVRGLEQYLVRTLLSGAFSGLPDQVIDRCVARIKEDGAFEVDHLFDVIRGEGRNLEITADQLLASGYGSDTIHLIFNLWYSFDYTPAYENNLPQVDHIFPQSQLRKIKEVNPNTGRKDLIKYKEPVRNQLANCMLLTQIENGSGGKSDTPPSEWFKNKPPAYLDQHLIPRDPSLWELDQYEAFVEERKRLIAEKFAWLLQGTGSSR